MKKEYEKQQQKGRCSSKCPYGLDTPALLERNLKDYEEILDGKDY